MTHKIKIGNAIYEANLDFRVAIECNRIAEDETIGDHERILGIIATMFGEHGLDNKEHYNKLMEWIIKYLSLGIETQDSKEKNEEPDIDYILDKKYIISSFKYDYQYNPYEKDFLSWEDFYNDLNNLSNNEFGTCCILNRIRYFRNMDTSKIKDPNERTKAEEIKKRVALHKTKSKKNYTNEELNNMEEFYKQTGL